LCNRPPEGVGLHVIGEPAPAVDLHNGQPLAVFGFEGGIAGDVDLAQVEAELLAELGDHAAGFLAEMAPRGVVDDDFGYG
jgi:hypothetical protein